MCVCVCVEGGGRRGGEDKICVCVEGGGRGGGEDKIPTYFE